jgi:hypothetical protein
MPEAIPEENIPVDYVPEQDADNDEIEDMSASVAAPTPEADANP